MTQSIGLMAGTYSISLKKSEDMTNSNYLIFPIYENCDFTNR